MPLMILRMNMFCYSAFQYNTRLKIITIVFTVTRWICRSYNLHSSENEFHFMIENQKYSLHKKWSFPLRISSVNFEICRKLWIWSHLLRKSLMEDFIFRAMIIFHIAVLWMLPSKTFVNPVLTNVPILYPLKTLENVWFSGNLGR